MNERVRLVAALLEGNETFTEICERFGISRKQGYKWRERYESSGVEALRDGTPFSSLVPEGSRA